MAALLSVLMIIVAFKAILGLWILVKALQVSFGWFCFLFLVGLASVLGAQSLGPVNSSVMLLVGTLLFVVNYWHEVRTPVLLFIAATVVHAVDVVQAGRTLAEQEKQAATEQRR